MGFVLNTDFSTIAPNEGAGSFFPVSDSKGWLVQMTDSEGKENSKKTGMILAVKLVGLDGPIAGKTHEYTINLSNSESQKAAEIGLGECSAIAHVTGHIKVGNSAEWHNKPFRVVVMPELNKDTKEPTGRNVITKYLDVNGNGPKDAGKGMMNAGQSGGGFGGGQTQGAGAGFQQQGNAQAQAGGFQQGGNQGQAQQGFNQGGAGFGNGQGQQEQTGFGTNAGQQGQTNAQGGQPNPGTQFQPNGGGGFDPNAAQNGQQQQGAGFQQGGGAQMGGWGRS